MFDGRGCRTDVVGVGTRRKTLGGSTRGFGGISANHYTAVPESKGKWAGWSSTLGIICALT